MTLLPALGQIAGQFGINQLTANQQNRRIEKRLKEQRHYDSPKEQVKRLKEAGLSGSLMMAQGSAGQQSPAPVADIPETNIGREMGKYHETRFTKLQQQMAQQVLRQETAKADLLENERDYDMKKAVHMRFDEATQTEHVTQSDMTNLQQRKEYHQIISMLEPDIKQAELNIETARSGTERRRILATINNTIQNTLESRSRTKLHKKELRFFEITENALNAMDQKDFRKYIQNVIKVVLLNLATRR